MPFNKINLNPPKSFEELLSILAHDHKLDIDLSNANEIYHAKLIIRNMNYYIIKGYGLSGNLLSRNGKDGYEFKPNTKINTLYDLYLFDCELKNILIYAIGIIEKNLRSTIANYLCCKYNDPECGDINVCHTEESMNVLLCVKERVKNDFKKHNIQNEVIAHFINDKYGHFPIWVIIESFSFGDLFYFYINLSEPDKFAIARKYGVNIPMLTNWIYAIKWIRNICCHFNRLYGKPLISLKNNNKLGITQENSTTLFSIIKVIKYLLKTCDIEQSNLFVDRIIKLIKKYNHLDLSNLSLSSDWIEELNK